MRDWGGPGIRGRMYRIGDEGYKGWRKDVRNKKLKIGAEGKDGKNGQRWGVKDWGGPGVRGRMHRIGDKGCKGWIHTHTHTAYLTNYVIT